MEILDGQIDIFGNIHKKEIMENKELEKFNKLLDKKPDNKWVEIGEYGGKKYRYLPIRKVEELLKEVFGAVQYKKSGNIMIVGNNVVYSLDVLVFHPVLKEWLTYNGVSAVPLNVDSEGNTHDLQPLIPLSKALAITNAARYIGRYFGSHLNEEDKVKADNPAGLLSELGTKK